MVGIIEPRVRIEKIEDTLSLFRDERNWTFSFREGRVRLIVLWRKSVNSCILDSSDQVITCESDCKK